MLEKKCNKLTGNSTQLDFFVREKSRRPANIITYWEWRGCLHGGQWAAVTSHKASRRQNEGKQIQNKVWVRDETDGELDGREGMLPKVCIFAQM